MSCSLHSAALLLAALASGVAGDGPEIVSTVGTVLGTSIEVPGPGFPGDTPETSNAFWPTSGRGSNSAGMQPPRLRYWPQLSYGLANRTLLGCWKTQVLHSTADGWPGLCVNLAKKHGSFSEHSCKRFCYGEPRCSVWQFVNQTSPHECWVGYGTGCGTRRSPPHDIKVQASERIMHGSVKILKYLKGWRFNNLYNLKMESDEQTSISRCKAWCYSSISCNYWQYGAKAGGCFVDAPMFSTEMNTYPEKIVQYPLTTEGGVEKDDAFEWGEYITHYCPPHFETSFEEHTVPLRHVHKVTRFFSSWLTSWLLIGLLGATAIGGAVYFQSADAGKTGKRKVLAQKAKGATAITRERGSIQEQTPFMAAKPTHHLDDDQPPQSRADFASGLGSAAAQRSHEPVPPPRSEVSFGGYGSQPAGGGFAAAAANGPAAQATTTATTPATAPTTYYSGASVGGGGGGGGMASSAAPTQVMNNNNFRHTGLAAAETQVSVPMPVLGSGYGQQPRVEAQMTRHLHRQPSGGAAASNNSFGAAPAAPRLGDPAAPTTLLQPGMPFPTRPYAPNR